ncbi:hypothetical protein SPW_6493 [Streptomyces sp. W007]|nr:hypothetical protein SPW_6493 [Streptomyces sp. W007]
MYGARAAGLCCEHLGTAVLGRQLQHGIDVVWVYLDRDILPVAGFLDGGLGFAQCRELSSRGDQASLGVVDGPAQWCERAGLGHLQQASVVDIGMGAPRFQQLKSHQSFEGLGRHRMRQAHLAGQFAAGARALPQCLRVESLHGQDQ